MLIINKFLPLEASCSSFCNIFGLKSSMYAQTLGMLLMDKFLSLAMMF